MHTLLRDHPNNHLYPFVKLSAFVFQSPDWLIYVRFGPADMASIEEERHAVVASPLLVGLLPWQTLKTKLSTLAVALHVTCAATPSI